MTRKISTQARTGQCVLIVEDHALVADAMSALLLKIDPHLQVTLCASAHAALAAFERIPQWSKIFLDLDVPGAYGLSLARQFAKLQVAKSCVVITAFNNQQWIAEVKNLGMLGYIVKASNIENFTAAVKAVMRGECAFPSSSVHAPRATHLTRRQLDMLCLLQRGYTSKKIATHLNLSEGTIDNHIAATMQALGVSSRAHAVIKATTLGYLNIDGMN